MNQYSSYVDRINKNSNTSKVNLVDVKCPPSKNVLRLLPGRPRSGDKSLRHDVTKERERPGSLTLRSFPPDARGVNKGPSSGGKVVPAAEPLLPRTQSVVSQKSQVTARIRTGRNIQRTGPAARPSKPGLTSQNSLHSTYGANRASRSSLPPRETYKKPEKPMKPIGVEIIKQSTLDFGYQQPAGGAFKVLSYEQFLEEQRKRRKGSSYSRASSNRTYNSSFKEAPVNTISRAKTRAQEKKGGKGGKGKKGVDKTTSSTSITTSANTSRTAVVKGNGASTSSLTKSTENPNQKPSPVKKSKSKNSDRELATQPGKRRNFRPSSASSRKSTDSRSDPEGQPGKGWNIRRDPKEVIDPRKSAGDHLKPEEFELSTSSFHNRKENKGRSSNLGTTSVHPPPGADQKSNQQDPSHDHKEPRSKRGERNTTTKDPGTSEKPRKEKKSNIGEKTGVNVSVFTRDNITVSPADVVVSRTVHKEKTTILVTVPHSSNALFERSKIGKVEISLESPTPSSRNVETISSQSSDSQSTVLDSPFETIGTPAPRERDEDLVLHRVETVDSGYNSVTGSIGNLHKSRALAREESSKYLTSPENSSKSIVSRSDRSSVARPTPTKKYSEKVSVSHTKKPAEPAKPSPYGGNTQIADNCELKTSLASRAINTKDIVTEASPYGSAARLSRFRPVTLDQSPKPLLTKKQQSEEKRKLQQKTDEKRRRMTEYSARTLARAKVCSSGKAAIRRQQLKSSSLPSVNKAVVRKRASLYCSDLALNRNRMLGAI